MGPGGSPRDQGVSGQSMSSLCSSASRHRYTEHVRCGCVNVWCDGPVAPPLQGMTWPVPSSGEQVTAERR